MKKTMQMNFVDYKFYSDKNNKKNAIVGGLFKFDNTEKLPFKEKIIENLNKRINIYPILSSKIVESKIKNDYPYYVTDKNFNINNHVFEYNVFSQEEFNTLVKKIWIKEIQLDKPLWEYHIINYSKNTYVLRRCHHAMGDGTQLSESAAFSDYFKDRKKINNLNTVSKKRSYFNKSIKILKMYYLFLKGFITKNNKQTKIKQFKRENIYRGEWRNKKEYSLDFSFVKFNLNEIESYLKDKSISTLEFSFLLETLCYQGILGEKVVEKKDLISLIPRSHGDIKHYGNEIITLMVDVPTSEVSIDKAIMRIKQSIGNQTHMLNTSAHKDYAKAFRTNPNISSAQKGFRYANMCDWNGKKKIPKYKKDFFPIATSTTYFNVDILSKTTVHGKKIEESYGISMPISIPGSIGVTLHFRKQNDYLYVGITSFKEIFSADKVKESLINSFNRIKTLA